MPINGDDKIEHILSDLWKKNLPVLKDRLDLLDRTAWAAASGDLTEAARTEALSIAHKLSGSLGMFGYTEGTEIARQIEHLLKQPASENLNSLTELTIDLRKTLAAGL
jgi:HPt (histidine-containing phosphotransfer) domain-containing protein